MAARVSNVLKGIALAGMVSYAVVREMVLPQRGADALPAAPHAAMPGRLRLIVKTAALTALAGIVLAIGGGLLFIFSGVYELAAAKPHSAPVEWVLQALKTRSVRLHSAPIQVPKLGDGAQLKGGFMLYRKNCQPCHGAPGVPAEQMGLGINPKPPELVTASTKWSEAEMYWIISEGLKMSGMPAFSPRFSDGDRWAMVAFVRRLNRLSPADYQSVAAEVDRGLEPASWGSDDEEGFARLKSANPDSGRRLVRQYGCTACHAIAGADSGRAGPPLMDFAARPYIAGSFVNTPTNAVKWVMDPQKYKPGTMMPSIGVTASDAFDMIAFLYRSGDQRRLNLFRERR